MGPPFQTYRSAAVPEFPLLSLLSLRGTVSQPTWQLIVLSNEPLVWSALALSKAEFLHAVLLHCHKPNFRMQC